IPLCGRDLAIAHDDPFFGGRFVSVAQITPISQQGVLHLPIESAIPNSALQRTSTRKLLGRKRYTSSRAGRSR
ncbi:MAG TPA: hypothetical protein VNM92_07475, partial [Thermoanaerobaculia bacterium]|nr:hypothetical protein [Thermoanaerobaculia bacterium]